MYDASAKFPTGILSGKSFDFGDYDECLETNTIGLDFTSQYCVVNIRFKPSIKLYPNYYKTIVTELNSSVPVWEAIKVYIFIIIIFIVKIFSKISNHLFGYNMCVLTNIFNVFNFSSHSKTQNIL